MISSVPRRCIHRLKSYQIRGSGKTLTNKKLFIKKQLTKKLQSSDLCGVAVISAIFAQKDIEAATRRLHDTEMNACFSSEERTQLAEEIPAGRFGAPEEVASLAVQITTGNDYLTGQIITLDGGYL